MKKLLKTLYALFIAILDNVALIRYPVDEIKPQLKATVKFSALVTDIKGKIGGTVFQGSKVGGIVKNKPNGKYVKAIPWVYGAPYTITNWLGSMQSLLDYAGGLAAPDGSLSAYPTVFRPQQLTSTLSKAWSQLSSSQQAAWESAAPNFPFKNKYGQSYTASGYQVFQSINNKLMYYNQTMQTLPPSANDGDLATWPWDTIYIETNPTFANFMQLNIPDGICPGAIVEVVCADNKPRKRLKTVFGGKGQIAMRTQAPSTMELLPQFNMLFGFVYVGQVINFTVNVINASNAHIVYTANFYTIIPELDNTELVSTSYLGETPVGSPISPNLILDWQAGDRSFDFGNVTVDTSSNTKYITLKGIQFPPKTNITFTQGGADPPIFRIFIAGSDDALDGSITLQTDGYGKLFGTPIVADFNPIATGLQTATITISSPSLTTPVVLTFTGTGI